MAYNFKEYMERPDRLTAGHRMCAGCGASIALRNVLKAVKPEDHAVISNATSCMEVSTFIYPYTAWEDSYIHTAFEKHTVPWLKRVRLTVHISLLLLEVMVVPMILVSSPSRALWKEIQIWSMSAMIMKHT